MTFAYSTDLRDGSQRRFMLILLAVNLFLAGIIGAFLIKSYLGDPLPHRHGGPAQRIEMIASRLQPSDAAILRAEFVKKAEAIAQASEAFRQAREKTRAALRAEPFDADAARAAMAEASARRYESEQLFQDVIASAAELMTQDGRKVLADWPPHPGASAQAAAPLLALLDWTALR